MLQRFFVNIRSCAGYKTQENRKMVAIINVLMSLNMISAAVMGDPRYFIKSPQIVNSQKPAVCLPLGKPCMKSKDPCCTLVYQKSYLGLGSVPTTCFKFGKGICQVNQSIENFDKYSKLVNQLNDTNFQEMKQKYWSSIPVAYTCPQKVTIEIKSA